MSEPACTRWRHWTLRREEALLSRLSAPNLYRERCHWGQTDVSLDMILITLVILSGCSRDRRHLKPLLYAKIPIKVWRQKDSVGRVSTFSLWNTKEVVPLLISGSGIAEKLRRNYREIASEQKRWIIMARAIVMARRTTMPHHREITNNGGLGNFSVIWCPGRGDFVRVFPAQDCQILWFAISVNHCTY